MLSFPTVPSTPEAPLLELLLLHHHPLYFFGIVFARAFPSAKVLIVFLKGFFYTRIIVYGS